MIIHICCSVDSHYFLKRIRETLPHENLKGFFYNPNIHPHEEYHLRLVDTQRSCKKYNIELFEGEYDAENWVARHKHLENEKERGIRCEECFKMRLQATAEFAKKMGEKSVTTTLFMSPKKSFSQLENAAKEISEKEQIEVLCFDFRKNGGTQAQFKLAREEKLYHQNYCGCLYALKDQREAQKRLATELISPIGREILPCSAQEKIKIYQKAKKLEAKKQTFEIERKKVDIFRLLWGRVLDGKNVVPSYFIGECFAGIFHVTEAKNGFGFTAENVLFVELKKFNEMAKTEHKSVKELIFNPLTSDKQRRMQKKFHNCAFITVVEKIKKRAYKIEAISTSYSDIMEVLATLR